MPPVPDDPVVPLPAPDDPLIPLPDEPVALLLGEPLIPVPPPDDPLVPAPPEPAPLQPAISTLEISTAKDSIFIVIPLPSFKH